MDSRIVYSGGSLKYLHSKVMILLKIASLFNGHAYGGYVRDVVTRVISMNFTPVSIKDVDIWFKTDADRDAFITKCSEIVGDAFLNTNYRTSQGTSMGDRSIQYVLYDGYGDMLTYVDLVVYDVLPVWDLSVNHLVYDCASNKITTVFPYNLSCILGEIAQKAATLDNRASIVYAVSDPNRTRERGTFTVTICPDHEVEVHTSQFRKRLDRFVERGWTIRLTDGCVYVPSSNKEL